MNNYISPKHTVAVFTLVRNSDRNLLLVKCRDRGWEMQGGHVEQGESLVDAAIRETKEESGINIKLGFGMQTMI